MADTEVVELRGHIIDSMILPRVLDEIVESGAEYRIVKFEIGKTHDDPSSAVIELTGERATLDRLLGTLADFGASPPEQGDARLVAADVDGALPNGFYSTTNLPTEVRIDGRWVAVDNPEMDCAIVVDGGAPRTVPMGDVRRGDLVVCGHAGIRAHPLERPRDPEAQPFGFMSSAVSSEKPQWVMVQRIAGAARRAKEAGQKLLWVLGPAVIHTGTIDDFAWLVRNGWVDVVFAGNALATHDVEAAMFGTSLGVSLAEGIPAEHGHEHHIRAINEVRRAGSLRAAVEVGIVRGGVMFELVRHGIPFVLAGSVRDDGPMPDVVTDMLEAQRRMREHIPGVGMAIMLSTMLHSIATGNMLPATVTTVCVDINPAAVTKLMDRGSHQSVGMVTDVGLFLRQLREALAGER